MGCRGFSDNRRGALHSARLILAILFGLCSTPSFADIDIQISGVTEVLERNVREFMSMTRYAERADLSEEIVSRLARRIPSEVRSALEPLGYYSATATYEVTSDAADWVVLIRIDPGRAVRISQAEVTVVGDGANDADLQALLKREDLRPGARLDHGVYEAVKGEMLRIATHNGYLDAKLTRNEMIVDPVERRASVYLSMDTGERYRFGVIDVEQPVLKDAMARKLLRMKQGDPYTLDAILESQYLYDDSQYFRAVTIEPGAPNRETREVPLVVRAERNRRNRYSVSAGYGTDTDARGKLAWDNRFLNTRGHRLQTQLTGSSILQEAGVKYVVPVMDVALEKLEADVFIREEELGDLLSRRTGLGLGLTQVLGQWQRSIFVRLSNEKTESVAAASEVPEGSTFLIIPGISFATMPPTLLERKRRRYSINAELTGSPETLGSDATFLQLRTTGERVFDLAPRWDLRLRGQVGLTWSDNFNTLPASHRFFAGGDNSIRGFGLNELSPVDEATGTRVGARYLLVGSVELERALPVIFGISNLSAATFVDAGNAFDRFSDPIEYSAGLGLRYNLAGVASIGVDVAQALSQSGRSPRVHLRLTTLF